MNFTTPFGVPITTTLPITTQFQGGKLTQNVTTANGQVVGVLHGGENGVHFIRPLDMNTFSSQPTHHHQMNGQQEQHQTVITLPITMPGAKPGDPQQTVQIQVINPNQMSPPSPGGSPKYQMTPIPIQTFGQGATVLTVAYNSNQEGIQIVDGQNGIPEGMTVVAALQPADVQNLQVIQAATDGDKSKDMLPVALIKSEMGKEDVGQEQMGVTAIPAQFLHNASAVQEYLQKMQQNTALPFSLQQFLKFNSPTIKQEIGDDSVDNSTASGFSGGELVLQDVVYQENEEGVDEKGKKKKKYKKKTPKPKKPKPGQVHIATALDGTTLFCCPECHMAYPEKELLEQHLVGHKIERRFICDICGAGLKRKEHLERHKLGHNPERPFVCSVCMKGFKRKEHLNLHFVIHSGHKTEICDECGKGFYRKDHLRKHQRSHEMRRAKELAERQQNTTVISKDGTTSIQDGQSSQTTQQHTVTIQMPTSQLQIPVQIQVPQHHIQMTSQGDDDDGEVSTVVLPTNEGQLIPVIQVPQHHMQVSHQQDDDDSESSTVVLPSHNEGLSILPN